MELVEPTEEEASLYRDSLRESYHPECAILRLGTLVVDLTSFLFGFYTPMYVRIELVCTTKVLAKELLSHFEERLPVYCLAEDSPRKWYEDLGFVHTHMIDVVRSFPKAYCLTKTLS